MKNHDAKRVVRMCLRIQMEHCYKGHPFRAAVWATKLWNTIDSVAADQDPEGLWDIMEMLLPEMFNSLHRLGGQNGFNFTYRD